MLVNSINKKESIKGLKWAKMLKNRAGTAKNVALIYGGSEFLRIFAVHFGQWRLKFKPFIKGQKQ